MTIKTFGQDQDDVNICDVVNCHLKSLQNDFCLEVNVLEVPMICSPLLQGQSIRWAKGNFQYLKGLKLDDYLPGSQAELEVDVLLGSDFMWQTIQGEENEPVAIGTEPVENMPRTLLSNVNLTAMHVLRVDHQPVLEQNKDEMLDKRVINCLIKKVWESASETDSVHELFLQNIKFDNNQYSVKLPWREQQHQILPDNFELSVN